MENKKRDYPLFIIDRSKPESHPYDFVVCLDDAIGFVAKFIHCNSELTFNFYVQLLEIEPSSQWNYELKKLRKGGLVLHIEEFLHEVVMTAKNEKRVQWLLKKAMNKYIFAEVSRTPQGDLGIDNQIKQQQLSIDRAKSQYNALVARSSVEEADFAIQIAEATLHTLKIFKDNQRYFITSNN